MWVSFEVHPLQNNRYTVVRCEKPVVDKRAVKNSSGISETRYVISSLIELGDVTWEIELTLANRDSMGYRMLLGRSGMADRLLIDPSQNLCLGDISADKLENFYGTDRPERSGLKIGLLASNINIYSNQRILETG